MKFQYTLSTRIRCTVKIILFFIPFACVSFLSFGWMEQALKLMELDAAAARNQFELCERIREAFESGFFYPFTKNPEYAPIFFTLFLLIGIIIIGFVGYFCQTCLMEIWGKKKCPR